MLNKIRLLTLAMTAVLLGGLIYMAVLTYEKNYDDLLLFAPQNQAAGGAPSLITELEDLNLESFRLTYEILESKNILSERSSTGATVKWTNFTYPYVCGYNIASGGFFTQAAQEQFNKAAVLNESAAFELFGSYNIVGSEITLDNTSYTVTGVINDQDKDSNNIYLPVTLQNQGPSAIIASVSGTAAQELIENKLKSIGVTDTSHYIYNLGLIGGTITGRALTALYAIGCAVLIFIIRKCLRVFLSCYAELRKLYKYDSIPGVITRSPVNAVKSVFSAILTVGGCGLMIWFVSAIANLLLEWGTFATDIDAYVTDFFSGKLDIIQKYSGVSETAFVLFIVFLVIDVILLLDTDR